MQKTALPPFLIDARLRWALEVLKLAHNKAWYAQHCARFDSCATMIPGAPRSAFDANQASYGKSKRCAEI